jgi:hypothetical protein
VEDQDWRPSGCGTARWAWQAAKGALRGRSKPGIAIVIVAAYGESIRPVAQGHKGLLGRVTELYRSEPGTARTDIVCTRLNKPACPLRGGLMPFTWDIVGGNMTVDKGQPRTRRKLLLTVLGGAVAAVLGREKE